MDSQRQAAGHSAGTLWFNPPGGEENRRRALTSDHVVAEALAIISAGGAAALSMRALAARVGVVPAALYRHARSKEQLYDLILDRVLAEVGCQADPPSRGPGRSSRSPAGSPRWPPSAHTPGPATATSGSPPASTPSSPACGQPSAPAPATPPSQLKRDPPGQLAQMAGREHPRRCRDRPGDRHDGSTDRRQHR
jgi:hypothetical protein